MDHEACQLYGGFLHKGTKSITCQYLPEKMWKIGSVGRESFNYILEMSEGLPLHVSETCYVFNYIFNSELNQNVHSARAQCLFWHETPLDIMKRKQVSPNRKEFSLA